MMIIRDKLEGSEVIPRDQASMFFSWTAIQFRSPSAKRQEVTPGSS
ncbi:hypothetical protein LINPERHAP2_LOCUS334 [Linum perenne]